MLLNTERHDEHLKKDLFEKLNKNNDFRKTWFKTKDVNKHSDGRLDTKSSYLNSHRFKSRDYNRQASKESKKTNKNEMTERAYQTMRNIEDISPIGFSNDDQYVLNQITKFDNIHTEKADQEMRMETQETKMRGMTSD